MQYVEYQPVKPLQAFINCFWSIEPDADEAPSVSWDRTVPDGSLELVLHLAEPMRRKSLDGSATQESRAIVIGQTTRPYLIAPTGPTRMLGVRFFPHTGFLFLDGPVMQFNDQSVDLDAILLRDARLPVEQIGNAGNMPSAVRLLEDWCMKRLQSRSVHARDRHFFHACRRLLSHKAMLSIADLSHELGISNRYLERLFLERSGISPKLFARIIRFQNALGCLSAGVPRTLAAIAHDVGYFDQSHFIREFRQFTGLAPGEFVKEQHPFTAYFADPGNSSYLYNFR